MNQSLHIIMDKHQSTNTKLHPFLISVKRPKTYIYYIYPNYKHTRNEVDTYICDQCIAIEHTLYKIQSHNKTATQQQQTTTI